MVFRIPGGTVGETTVMVSEMPSSGRGTQMTTKTSASSRDPTCPGARRRRRATAAAVAVALLLVIPAAVAAQSQGPSVTVRAARNRKDVRLATQVVAGTIEKISTWNHDHSRIYTRVTMRVELCYRSGWRQMQCSVSRAAPSE